MGRENKKLLNKTTKNRHKAQRKDQMIQSTQTIPTILTIPTDKKNARLKLKKKLHNYRYMYLLVIPGFVYFIIFKIAPLWGLTLVFKDYNPYKGFLGSEWIWFDNFITFFTSNHFYLMLRNTVAITQIDISMYEVAIVDGANRMQ